MYVALPKGRWHNQRMGDDRVTAAGRVIYEAGRVHRWPGFEKPFEEMDSIALSEFLGIVEQALFAANLFDANGKSKVL
jgi:hypothetical protein